MAALSFETKTDAQRWSVCHCTAVAARKAMTLSDCRFRWDCIWNNYQQWRRTTSRRHNHRHRFFRSDRSISRWDRNLDDRQRWGLGSHQFGGIASNTTISGGVSGAAGTVFSGGTVQLRSGGVVSGAITFAPAPTTHAALKTNKDGTVTGGYTWTGWKSGTGGKLIISGTSMPSSLVPGGGAVISGFASQDTIDLASIPYVSAGATSSGATTTVIAGNVLQIVEGGSTYKLQLNPSENFSNVSFKAFSDGSGGTNISLAAGIDVGSYLGSATMQSLMNTTNLAWVANYLPASSHSSKLTPYAPGLSDLVKQGWQIGNVYVGYQDNQPKVKGDKNWWRAGRA
jgi:hypothetical protein